MCVFMPNKNKAPCPKNQFMKPKLVLQTGNFVAIFTSICVYGRLYYKLFA